MTNVATTSGGGIPPLDGPAQPRGSGLRVLVWIVGLVVAVVMIISILLPSLCRPRETANRVKCASNLRQLGQAIALYAADHGGDYPPSLSTVLATQDLTAEVMICPSTNDEKSAATDTAAAVADVRAAETNAAEHKPCLSYIYVGAGLNAKRVSDETIVAYEPPDNHDKQGGNVLYGDGHVSFEGKEELRRIAEKAAANAARSSTQPAQ